MENRAQVSTREVLRDGAPVYIAASSIAALLEYPLWRQRVSTYFGVKVTTSNPLTRYYQAATQNHPQGLVFTLVGLSMPRAAIFLGSDVGKAIMLDQYNSKPVAAQFVPPLVVGTAVLFINMPFVRARYWIQDPHTSERTVRHALVAMYGRGGWSNVLYGWFRNVYSALPKYTCAIAVRDYVDNLWITEREPLDRWSWYTRSAIKAGIASLAAAAMATPFRFHRLRDEFFQSGRGLLPSATKLWQKEGWAVLSMRWKVNLSVFSLPFSVTLFLIDAFRFPAAR